MSGIIVSTGAGTGGWQQSVYAGAASVVKALGGKDIPPPASGRLPCDTEVLMFAVREPFPSKTTRTQLTFGTITHNKLLVLTSHMADNGGIRVGRTQSYVGGRVRRAPCLHTARPKPPNTPCSRS